MKCPKCNYVSFDYNQACPRCNKDISLEQEKLNIPAFKPAPPSLLNSLLGDGAQSDGHLSGSAGVQTTRQEHSLDEATVRLDESFLNDSQEIDLDPHVQEDRDGLGLEGILEEPEGIEVGPLQDGASAEKELHPQEKPEIAGTICLEEAEVFPSQQPEKEDLEGEISLDLEEITLDSSEQAQTGQGAGQADDSLEIDLGDFSLEDAGAETLQTSSEDTGAQKTDAGINFLRDEKASEPEETDEITLTLDDLKVNETGQLEIGRLMPDLSSKSEPVETDASSPNPENRPDPDVEGEDDLSLLLSDDAIEIPAASESVESLDLENLDLELDLDGSERK